MSENQNYTSNAEEEISLVDLFSVLIRHRLMIIWGTAVIFVIAAVYLFICPLLFPKMLKKEVTVKYNISITSVPGAISSELPAKYANLKSVLSSQITDVFFLIDELGKNNPWATEDQKEMDTYNFNQFIQQILTSKKITVTQIAVRDEVVIELKIPKQNIETATNMVNSMVDSINNDISYVFVKEVTNLKRIKQETYDEIAKTYSENSNIIDAQKLLLSVRQINEFMQSYDCVINNVAGPFVVEQPLGRVKKLVIVTFAAFFVLVFIAFLKNAIENIKADPEASGKIKDAWEGGKIIKK